MFVFLVDANPLLSAWLTKLAPREGHRLYHMATVADAPFFVTDLKPDVLVLDGSTLREGEEVFRKAWEASPALRMLPLVGLGEALPGWLSPRGHMPKPLDPSQFFGRVAELVVQ